MKNIATILILITALISSYAYADIQCDEVIYSKTNYIENMEKLAIAAKLPDNYFNKYHQEVVKHLCSGELNKINKLVDYGHVKAKEAESIAQVLGKQYKAPARSEEGKLYQSVYLKLLESGACNSCASNAADEYVQNPKGSIAKLVQTALTGDKNAITILNESNKNENGSVGSKKQEQQNNERVNSQSDKPSNTPESDSEFDKLYKNISSKLDNTISLLSEKKPTASDVGQLYKNISSKLDDAISLLNQKLTAPEHAVFTKDKNDIQEKIEKILKAVSEILDVSNINEVKEKIKSLKKEIKNSEDKKAKLEEKTLIENKNYSEEIAKEDETIRKSQAEINFLKTEFNNQLSKIGFRLDSNQLDVLLSSVLSDDIISMSVIFDNIKQLTLKLESLMRQSKENLDYAKKYYGMYLLLLQTLDVIQDEFIAKVNSVYIPSVKKIAQEAQNNIQEAEVGISADKGNVEILQRNIESNQLTIKTSELYLKHLNQQKDAIQVMNNKLQKDIFTAENTYKTVATSSELFSMLQIGLKEFSAITKLELPTFLVFENLQMKNEFEKLTDKLKPASN